MTYLVKTNDSNHYKRINFKSLISKVKKEYNYEYSCVQANVANAAIKKHVESLIFCGVEDKRIQRGLYKTLTGKLINADVNAAANIIRKNKQKFNKE